MSNENIDTDNDVVLIDENDKRLKGDAIGDTLYSESWLLRTLVLLTKELPKYSDDSQVTELEESLETDLCLLWDMTADKEVAECLYHHNILDIIKCVVEESSAPRLTEISVGILANLSCHQDIGSQIISDKEWTSVLVNLLSGSDDSPTLIQVVRLLDVLSRSYSTDQCANFIQLEPLWLSLSFIQQNSLNEELLCASCKLLDVLTSHIDPDQSFPCQSILLGIIECQKQLKTFNDSQTIRQAMDALNSALYHFGRIDSMRRQMVDCGESVCGFVDVYLSGLLDTIHPEDREGSLQQISAIEAVTVYSVVIQTADRPSAARFIELAGRIGRHLDQTDSADYLDVVGCCIRRYSDANGSESCLSVLKSIDPSILRFLFQSVPESLKSQLNLSLDGSH